MLPKGLPLGVPEVPRARQKSDRRSRDGATTATFALILVKKDKPERSRRTDIAGASGTGMVVVFPCGWWEREAGADQVRTVFVCHIPIPATCIAGQSDGAESRRFISRKPPSIRQVPAWRSSSALLQNRLDDDFARAQGGISATI